MPKAPQLTDLDAGLFILGARTGTTSLLATTYKWPDCTLRIEARFLTLKTPKASWSLMRSDVRNISFVSGGLIIEHESPQAPAYLALTTLDHRLIEKKLNALEYPIKSVKISVPDRSLAQLYFRFIPVYTVALVGWLLFIEHDLYRFYRALVGIGILALFTVIYLICRIFYSSNSIRNFHNPDLVRRFIYSIMGIVMTMNIIYIHSNDRIPFYTEYNQRRIAGLAAQTYLGRSPEGLTNESMARKLFQPKIFTRIQGEIDAKLMELKLNHLHTEGEISTVQLVDYQGMTEGVVTGIYVVKGNNINNPFEIRKPFTFSVLFGPTPYHDEEIADYHIEVK